MSKTTPVRWWRDDTTRYVTRGPQIVPAAASSAGNWTIELLRGPVDPDLQRVFDRLHEISSPAALAAACLIPDELLFGP